MNTLLAFILGLFGVVGLVIAYKYVQYMVERTSSNHNEIIKPILKTNAKI